MASPAVAPVKEQNRQGRIYYDKFITWCEKSKVVPNTELLMQWDADHNLSRIKAIFGDDRDVYRVGLMALYDRFFSRYSLLRVETPSGKRVTFRRYRKSGKGTHNLSDMSSPVTTADQLQYIKGRAKLVARNAAERLRVFSLSKKEIITLFTEAVEEAFAE